jgi:hypothetical protein
LITHVDLLIIDNESIIAPVQPGSFRVAASRANPPGIARAGTIIKANYVPIYIFLNFRCFLSIDVGVVKIADTI